MTPSKEDFIRQLKEHSQKVRMNANEETRLRFYFEDFIRDFNNGIINKTLKNEKTNIKGS